MIPLRRLTFCALAFAAACTSSSGAGTIGVAKGQNVVRFADARREPVKPFTGDPLRPGTLISSASFAGHVVVVNFWGSWCGPCRKEQPILERLATAYAAKGVIFVGVSTRDQKAAALAYLDEFRVSYASIYDPSATLSNDLHVRVMPDTHVIDKQGRIAATIYGALRTDADLTTLLDEELRA